MATTVCPRGVCTLRVARTFFSDTFSLRGVQTSRTRMAQGVSSAHVISLHLTLSILMCHPPSVLFPDGHFETTFPTLTSAPSLPESAGQAHFRTSGGEFGYLADPTHFTLRCSSRSAIWIVVFFSCLHFLKGFLLSGPSVASLLLQPYLLLCTKSTFLPNLLLRGL